MFRQVSSVCLSLVAEAQYPVRTLVFKRCNSTVAATQIRPDEWDYAKPFEDIPGPKPLPIIGNVWRFIPYIGNVFCCTVTVEYTHPSVPRVKKLVNEFIRIFLTSQKEVNAIMSSQVRKLK
jgi:hypothetical protein